MPFAKPPAQSDQLLRLAENYHHLKLDSVRWRKYHSKLTQKFHFNKFDTVELLTSQIGPLLKNIGDSRETPIVLPEFTLSVTAIDPNASLTDKLTICFRSSKLPQQIMEVSKINGQDTELITFAPDIDAHISLDSGKTTE
ncbi:hypothetical protein FWD07_02225 [Candidatus Saccharibacteria bacterium]|nr:hypothetical protein [Candidatus Saccharibacteria bacterium]